MQTRKINRAAGAALSVLAHIAVLAALLLIGAPQQRLDTFRSEPATFTVALFPKLPTTPVIAAPQTPASAAPAKAALAKGSAKQSTARRITLAHPSIILATSDKAALDPSDRVSDVELAGAQTAGGGGGSGGGDCDMLQRLQTALRKDDLVRSTVAATREARAIRIWNGDWVQGRGEDGKGLAAVREAIIWEVGFAPKACQAQQVRGLVALTLDDHSGARLVMGGGEWRWSDLLTLKSAAPGSR